MGDDLYGIDADKMARAYEGLHELTTNYFNAMVGVCLALAPVIEEFVDTACSALSSVIIADKTVAHYIKMVAPVMHYDKPRRFRVLMLRQRNPRVVLRKIRSGGNIYKKEVDYDNR